MKNLMMLIFLLTFSLLSTAQEDDLLNELMNEVKDEVSKKEITKATFKSTRIITAHSVEMPAHGVLEFRISHRFGAINSGPYNFFGLDQSFIRLALEYGFFKWAAAGIGRSSFEKTVDGYLKFKLLPQSNQVPVSIVWLSTMDINTLKWENPERKNYFSSRLAYNHQILIARKFNEQFSLQIMPTLTHKNLVTLNKDKNDIFSLGTGGRIKLTKRTSFNWEYFYVFPNQIFSYTYNPHYIAIGFDIETGGHVFQLHIDHIKNHFLLK